MADQSLRMGSWPGVHWFRESANLICLHSSHWTPVWSTKGNPWMLTCHTPSQSWQEVGRIWHWASLQKSHSSSTTRKYALWGRVTYILHLCQKDMSLACWVKIMGWDGVPWRRWPGEVTGSDHICAPCRPCTKLGTNSKIPLLPGEKKKEEENTLQPFPGATQNVIHFWS